MRYVNHRTVTLECYRVGIEGVDHHLNLTACPPRSVSKWADVGRRRSPNFPASHADEVANVIASASIARAASAFSLPEVGVLNMDSETAS